MTLYGSLRTPVRSASLLFALSGGINDNGARRHAPAALILLESRRMVSLSYLLGRATPETKSKRLEKRATTIYVSPSGSDSAAGTISAPLLTISAAVTKAVAGDTIYLRAGTYSPTTNIQITKSGTASARYTLSNYNGEKVIIDGEALPYTPGDLGSSIPSGSRGLLHITGSYWTIHGLELIHGPYGIYHDSASNNIYDLLITRDNYETGLQIQGSSSNNQVINLDSYGNHDPRKNGESADGLGIKEGTGTGNVVDGARIWNNVDDGLDFWEFKSPITVKNTIAWGNGFNRWNFDPFEGDGNGFKLGGGDAADIGVAAHVITNSIAFSNSAGGFVYNSQPGNMALKQNTAWNNAKRGFNFKDSSSTVTLTNNVGALNTEGNTDLISTVVQSGNSWNVGGTWNNASFKSVDASTMMGARLANGSITGSNFLIPTSYSIGASTLVHL
ncbi:polysaccharide lyase family 9 protein [Flagelloscypha sp. PMI_526]|nr:polysaccharide lyase family 9 protein [Flagelloscypha sp. PMI_526]